MTKKKLEFGFAAVGEADLKGAVRTDRSVGPMGAAIGDVGGNLQESSERLAERRRRNQRDAELYREAEREGRVLSMMPLADIRTDGLPRDRMDLDAVAMSEELEELKNSIRARGQREPIEVYRDGDGTYQLTKGWRRLTALRQLHAETGDEAFATAVTRITDEASERMDHYVDMVEENVIREDLTYAEMAQVAILAAGDVSIQGEPVDLVNRLYASMNKVKRSHIRSFVHLVTALGDDLRFPKSIARNLGLEVVRRLKESDADVDALRGRLVQCSAPERQTEVLTRFAKGSATGEERKGYRADRAPKLVVHVGNLKVTARGGECRIVSKADYSDVDRERLERAVKAFAGEMGMGGEAEG